MPQKHKPNSAKIPSHIGPTTCAFFCELLRTNRTWDRRVVGSNVSKPVAPKVRVSSHVPKGGSDATTKIKTGVQAHAVLRVALVCYLRCTPRVPHYIWRMNITCRPVVLKLRRRATTWKCHPNLHAPQLPKFVLQLPVIETQRTILGAQKDSSRSSLVAVTVP